MGLEFRPPSRHDRHDRRRPRCRPVSERLERRTLLLAGDLDATFNGIGFAVADVPGTSLDEARAVAVQADGKVVLVGSASTDSNFGGDFAVARLNADGSPDTSFGPVGNGGTIRPGVGVDGAAEAVLVQPDGKIVVGGGASASTTSGDYDFVILRFNPDGSPDATFADNGRFVLDLGNPGGGDRVYAMARQADGKIVAAGVGTAPGTAAAVLRLDAAGRLDPTFGSGGVATAFNTPRPLYQFGDVAVQPDGKIVLAASSNLTAGGPVKMAVARLTATGAVDGGFGNGGVVVEVPGGSFSHGTAVALAPDGSIYLAGTSGSALHETGAFTHLYKYNAAGARVTSFGVGNGSQVISEGGFFAFPVGLRVQPDGKVLVAATGSPGNYRGGTYGAYTLARLTPGGQFDRTFGAAGKVTGDTASRVYDLALAPGGRIVLGGYGGGRLLAARATSAARTPPASSEAAPTASCPPPAASTPST